MAKPTTKETAKAVKKEKVAAVANPELVEILKSYYESKDAAQSYLIQAGRLIETEELTRPEVVASIMEARGVEKSTAESQYSRMKNILSNPEIRAKFEAGELTLTAAVAATSKKQAAPSAAKQKENAEARFNKGVSLIVSAAKDAALGAAEIISSIRASLKDAGIR